MLVDSKCMTALKKIGLDKAANQLALTANQTEAAVSSMTMEFLKPEEETDGAFIAKLTVSVERVLP